MGNMTTRAELRTMIRRWERDVVGAQFFSDEELNQFIHDAIADYSVLSPRELTTTVNVVAGQREYTLSLTNLQGIVEVEYPKGQDPPQYLYGRSRYDPDGFYEGDWWDLAGGPDPTTLIIGRKPAAGEQVGLRYLADHLYPDSDGDTLTVPDRDLDELAVHTRARILQMLADVEGRVPTAAPLIEAKAMLAQSTTGRSPRRDRGRGGRGRR